MTDKTECYSTSVIREVYFTSVMTVFDQCNENIQFN